MFTVFGATGNTGSVVASELLAKGKRVRVVVRSEAKGGEWKAKGAEVAIGDVLDPTTVTAALAGAEGAYMLVPPDAQATDLVGRGRAIVDAYVRGLTTHPVKHVAFLSSIGAQEASGTGPIVITHNAEQALGKLAGTRFTWVRAAYFMENILANAHPMKGDGVLPVFGGGEGYPFPMIATRDIGRVAAEALAEGAPAANAIIELSGPKEYSFVDAATEATRLLGRKVQATPLPIEAMVPALVGVGISENVASLYKEMTQAFQRGLGFDGKGRAVRGKVTLGEVLAALT